MPGPGSVVDSQFRAKVKLEVAIVSNNVCPISTLADEPCGMHPKGDVDDFVVMMVCVCVVLEEVLSNESKHMLMISMVLPFDAVKTSLEGPWLFH